MKKGGIIMGKGGLKVGNVGLTVVGTTVDTNLDARRGLSRHPDGHHGIPRELPWVLPCVPIRGKSHWSSRGKFRGGNPAGSSGMPRGPMGPAEYHGIP